MDNSSVELRSGAESNDDLKVVFESFDQQLPSKPEPGFEIANTQNTKLQVHRIYLTSRVFEAENLAYIESRSFQPRHKGALLWQGQLNQVGLYALNGFRQAAFARVLCTVSHLANNGGFGRVHLQSINFAQKHTEHQSRASITEAFTTSISMN